MQSFVRKILHQSRDPNKYYFIGPNNEGSDGRKICDAAYDKAYEAPKSEPLILVGYSRGAAYCMKLAEWVAKYERRVDFLVMFDSVARNDYNQSRVASRYASMKGWDPVQIPMTVPPNVAICLHAVRDPYAGSRAGFGNVGLAAQDPGRTALFIRQDFFCSHGAMGGTPYDAVNEEGTTDHFGHTAQGLGANSNWMLNNTMPSDPRYANAPKHPVTNAAQDKAGSAAVGIWMWDLLRRFKIVPTQAEFHKSAPAFSGSQRPGAPNPMR